MKYKNFITFEGTDGSGKTTALEGLQKYLKKHSEINYIFTREPGGAENKTAEKIRKIILDKENIIDDQSEALLYASARRLHLSQTIWPALKKKKVVLCDRYIDSSLAYQGAGRGLGIDFVKELNVWATDDTWPNLTIFFDISPGKAKKRIQNRDTTDRLEEAGFALQKKVYKGYKTLIKKEPRRFAVIDATKSKEEVLEQVISIIKKELKIV